MNDSFCDKIIPNHFHFHHAHCEHVIVSNRKRDYFWNVHTNQVSWRHPNDPRADITYPACWQNTGTPTFERFPLNIDRIRLKPKEININRVLLIRVYHSIGDGGNLFIYLFIYLFVFAADDKETTNDTRHQQPGETRTLKSKVKVGKHPSLMKVSELSLNEREGKWSGVRF